MKLFSCQHQEAWAEALYRGLLTGKDPALTDEGWPDAYSWMRQQMAHRLPHHSGDYPTWAWLTRPDLRRSGPSTRGTPMVLLTIEVPPERVLVSDFMAWHFVLNDDYLPLDEADYLMREAFPPTRAEIRASWERIFDPDRLTKPQSFQALQACIDRVYVHEVVSVRHFRAK